MRTLRAGSSAYISAGKSYDCCHETIPQSDLGDGWEDPEVHNDSPETRLKALRMRTNLIQYVFSE
ncbi:MAG: DUF4159 domain-containing protein [Lentimicrobiaceae bacterium]|nr:DUF4159 domain-containing protein [Lentimicrobiaceae bacterium]MDD4598681.1 DUF4159 domain-containing protein [Lentimicrobiaceae bacterium]MDY0027078.1 DUF4159 domain-containing protein [Lentimicrobium sp.]HAH57655.1 hypothetical protein [Bacteroidales bacterium]